jgi:multiple sugar transport system permease protein
MLFGSYPSIDIYMLQHYLNNQFVAMNMARVSSAAYIMIIALGLMLFGVFYAQKRVTDMFY